MLKETEFWPELFGLMLLDDTHTAEGQGWEQGRPEEGATTMLGRAQCLRPTGAAARLDTTRGEKAE